MRILKVQYYIIEQGTGWKDTYILKYTRTNLKSQLVNRTETMQTVANKHMEMEILNLTFLKHF